MKLENIPESVAELQEKLYAIRDRSESVLKAYKDSDTYTVADSKGSVAGYKYFLYPFKNFSVTNPRDEEFIAKHLAHFIDKSVDYLVTFEADGIGITKLISVLTGIPMLVSKPFHYNQDVFSFSQKTGYYERTMYCPKLIQGKKIAIVDCIVSTGGTVRGFLDALQREKINAHVLGIYAVVNKTNYQTNTNLFDSIPYKYLFNVFVDELNKVVSAISDHFRDAFWTEVNTNIMQFTRDISKFADNKRNDFKVGATLVDDITLEILGWGFTGPSVHAEGNAIIMAQAKHDLKGRTLVMYTTLEPCVYRTIAGMTPCTELIKAIPEIRWVVIDARDEKDPKNHHEGIEGLKAAGRYVVCFEDHPSIALNYDPSLSKQVAFSS